MTGYFGALQDKAVGRSAVRIKNARLYGAPEPLPDVGAAVVDQGARVGAERPDPAPQVSRRGTSPTAAPTRAADHLPAAASRRPAFARVRDEDVAAAEAEGGQRRAASATDAGPQRVAQAPPGREALAQEAAVQEPRKHVPLGRKPIGRLPPANAIPSERTPEREQAQPIYDGPRLRHATGPQPIVVAPAIPRPDEFSAAAGKGEAVDAQGLRQPPPVSESPTVTSRPTATNMPSSSNRSAEGSAPAMAADAPPSPAILPRGRKRDEVEASAAPAAEVPQPPSDRVGAPRRGPARMSSIANQAALAVRRQVASAGATEAVTPPVIEVNIGRVEVRSPPARPSQPARSKPRLGLGDYLRRRTGRDAP
jgi:hypothetical protein